MPCEALEMTMTLVMCWVREVHEALDCAAVELGTPLTPLKDKLQCPEICFALALDAASSIFPGSDRHLSSYAYI